MFSADPQTTDLFLLGRDGIMQVFEVHPNYYLLLLSTVVGGRVEGSPPTFLPIVVFSSFVDFHCDSPQMKSTMWSALRAKLKFLLQSVQFRVRSPPSLSVLI